MDLPRLSEQQCPLITYQFEDGETVYEAITQAFRAIDFDVYDQKTTVEDWTENAPIDGSVFESVEPCRVSTIIWDHPIVITPGEIQIYGQ